jgi:hypothetical protein
MLDKNNTMVKHFQVKEQCVGINRLKRIHFLPRIDVGVREISPAAVVRSGGHQKQHRGVAGSRSRWSELGSSRILSVWSPDSSSGRTSCRSSRGRRTSRSLSVPPLRSEPLPPVAVRTLSPASSPVKRASICRVLGHLGFAVGLRLEGSMPWNWWRRRRWCRGVGSRRGEPLETARIGLGSTP